MTTLDLCAMVGAIVTGVTVFARSELLRPRVKSAYATNFLVRILMDVTALCAVFVAFEIWGGVSPPDSVAWFIILFAAKSSAMLISMFVHDARVVVADVRAADVVEMKDAVAEVMPAAMDAANARLLDRLDPTVPGYRFPDNRPGD